ncbi:hypothetical protein HRI_002006400 [Hibiscus trionum]|uniref:Endonuclease/exonuclease/phosphatase domain-containing protein n=1 Tax=Hibiscus trionum TaxID=183268 RepID=A0A9W7HU04_HIBTR|nr:hypothetical protein HRI_002006400 [Hibiscus trionum]
MNRCLLLSWNIRGLGKFEKKATVRNLVKKTRAKILFLQESKLQEVNGKIAGQLFGKHSSFNYCFSSSIGSAGGIITSWDPDFFEIENRLIDRNYIILIGKLVKENIRCCLVNVYASNDDSHRLQMFHALKNNLFDFNLPVILGGDFNVVSSTEERSEGSVNKVAIRNFNSFIEELAVIDLPLHGSRFTWSNYRDNPSFSRLDRFLLSTEFLRVWLDILQSAFPKGISDHNPICLAILNTCWGPRPFKWFNHLADDNEYVEQIIEAYNMASREGIEKMLKKCKLVSKAWVQSKSGNSIQEMEKRCAEIEEIIVKGNYDQ